MPPRVPDAINLSSSQLSSLSVTSTPTNPLSPTQTSPLPPYRPSKPLPYELQEHCTIYFEEGLYTQALIFLFSLISSGAASLHPIPALIPSPTLLRLISTLSVHPSLTNRAKSQDLLQAANLAVRYLRLVLQNVGPVQSNLGATFLFDGIASRGPRRRRTRGESPVKRNGPTDPFDVDAIENELAHSGSLFAQVDTFWSIVGWAFNCSLLHPNRWDRWSLWLEFIIDVLQSDWEFYENDSDKSSYSESLIVKYIDAGGGSMDSGRRILRAVFADGHATSVGEFPEVWRNETKELKAKSEEEARKAADKGIDILADDYGDYFSSSSSDVEDNLNDNASTASSSSDSTSYYSTSPSHPFGGPTALNLRFRLLSLLTTVCYAYPSAFTYSTPSADLSNQCTVRLYTDILSYLRPYPLPIFQHLFSRSTLLSAFPTEAASILLHCLLFKCALIETQAPEPEIYNLTHESLIESFLPWAGNASSNSTNTFQLPAPATASSKGTSRSHTPSRGRDRGKPHSKQAGRQTPTNQKNIVGIADTKVSICVETLLRLLDGVGSGLEWTPELDTAVERGIKRRESRVRAALVEAYADASGSLAGAGSGKISRGRGGRRRAGGGGNGRGGGSGTLPAGDGNNNTRGASEEWENSDAWIYLRESSQRIRLVVRLAREMDRGTDS